MRHLNVSCAIIEHEGLVLAVQRSSYMDNPLLWEFPGGKVEEGEEAAACIVREIQEELNISIQVAEALTPYRHTDKGRSITLIPFICRWTNGTLYLQEHVAACWLRPKELRMLKWSPADVPLVKDYIKKRQSI